MMIGQHELAKKVMKGKGGRWEEKAKVKSI